MSHRDQQGHTAAETHAQGLRSAFRWLLSETDFSGLKLRRDNTFTARGLALTALLWVWCDESTLLQRFQSAGRITRRLWPREVCRQVSYQAFVKQLVRWGDLLLLSLKAAFRRRLLTTLRSRFLLGEFSVFGVDGSRLELPRTTSNEECYAPSATRYGRTTRYARRPSRQSEQSRRMKGDGPQLWFTTLWHAGTGLVWDWRIGPSDSSERGHLRDMLDDLPPTALVTADAGFVGYDIWQALLSTGLQFVIRVGGNVRLLTKLGYVRESSGTVYLWPDREARRCMPPLVLRLVVVRDGRRSWYLVTSVLSRTRLDDVQVAELYRRRWGVEVLYRHFKQTFGRRKLRSHKAEHVRCEAHWAILGLNALLLYATMQLHRRGLAPARLSVAQALRVYRAALRDVTGRPVSEPSLRAALSSCLVDEYVRHDKRSRSYPRKKYEPPPRPPIIKTANRTQQTLAQHTKQTRKRLTA